MPKIAVLCPRTPRLHPGGLENSVIQVSRALKEAGFDLEIFATSKNPKKNAELNGIRIREFNAISPSDTFFFSPSLYSALKKADVDIIHCNGYNNLVTLAGLLAKRNSQKLILSIHSFHPSSLFRKILWVPFTLLMKMLSRRVNLFICNSDFEFNLVSKKLRIPKERFEIIPNGVDVELFDSIKRGKKRNYIISVGRLVKRKHFQDIIRALPSILKEFPGLKLKIVGKGPYYPKLLSLAKKLGLEKKVEFIGEIPFSQRGKLITQLKESRAFVFLSDYETQGIVVSEAITAGIPSIVSEEAALKGIVENAGLVGIKNPADKSEVSGKVIAVLKEPEKFKPKRQSICSWKETVEKTVRQFERVAEG